MHSSHRLTRVLLLNSVFLLLPSIVIQYYLSLQINLLFAAVGVLLLLTAFYESGGRINVSAVRVIIPVLSLGILGSAASGTTSQVLMASALSTCILVGFHGFPILADSRSSNYLTFVCALLVIGALIAVAYAYVGGSPLAEFVFGSSSYGDRITYLYLTTFTNAAFFNVIRPAGIFDEPGALAMFVTLIVALNEAFRRNTKWSGILLIAALITGSLFLAIVTVSYLLFKIHKRNIVWAVVALAAATFFWNTVEPVSELGSRFFLDRLEVANGRIVGDNRSHQVEYFLENVDADLTLSGAKTTRDLSNDFDQSSNPFSIWYSYGIFVWIPYALLVTWLLYCSIVYSPHLRFPAFALFLTLLQRPYLYSMYWGMMIVALAVVIYRLQRELPPPARLDSSRSLYTSAG